MDAFGEKETFRDFFRVLAVCHTVIPEGEPTPNTVCYQAESPDESAFVVAAKRFGFFFKARHTSAIEVDEPVSSDASAAAPSVASETKRFEILNILEFNSTRKRMSVIARVPEGEVVLYCKGADSVVYERLRHVAGGQTHAAATQAHMDDYAASGLRTLCLAKRTLTESEYAAWNATYTEAAQSLEKRDEKIAACAEAIEKELELLGATAIEDKLQDGVPGCIEQLMRAGIAVWVLTGDKQDTAINIGQACSLLREDMETHVININDLVQLESDRMISKEDFDARGREAVKAQIKNGIAMCDDCYARDVDVGVVIDGRSLAFALEPELAPDFLSLGTGCVSVVCCRVSPLQKALVTGLVKDSGKITLAIGDGANDVGMIQAAHIGVGISGQEGMQAVMASDFAFAQFRFLERLLLVHGRYNYKRVSRMVTYFFYKNIAFGLTLFAYNLETRVRAGGVQRLAHVRVQHLLCVPARARAWVFRPGREPAVVRAVPAPVQTRPGQRVLHAEHAGVLGAQRLLRLCRDVLFRVLRRARGEADTRDGRAFGLWEVGTTMYTGIVLTINLQMAQMINYWTWVQHCAIWGSIVIWYACNLILSDTDRYWSTYSYQIFTPTVAPTPKYWTATPLIVIVALLPDLIVRAARRLFKPEAHHLVQEYERLDKRLRARAGSVGRRGRLARRPRRHRRGGILQRILRCAHFGHADQAVAGGRRGAGDATVEREGFRVVRRGARRRRRRRQRLAAVERVFQPALLLGLERALARPGSPAPRVRGAHRRRAAFRQPAELPGHAAGHGEAGSGRRRAVRRREHSAVGASAAAASRASTATHSRNSSVVSAPDIPEDPDDGTRGEET